MKQTTERLSSLLTCVTAEDRKSFAALVSYVEGLPAGDDFLHFAELLGLLAAVDQRVPTAVGELLVELRAENTATVEHRGQVEERLANLPHEIAEGVNVTEIANGMAVAFRQQFAATGLQSSAGLIRDSSREITALSDKLSATLAPLGDNYTKIAGASVPNWNGSPQLIGRWLPTMPNSSANSRGTPGSGKACC